MGESETSTSDQPTTADQNPSDQADQPRRAGGTPAARSGPQLPPLDPRPLRQVHHGQTGAMWTGVVGVMVAFVVGGIAMLGPNWTLFVIACVLGVVGIVAALVLQALGFGLYERKSARD